MPERLSAFALSVAGVTGHCWCRQASGVGAFINLESTGPGGPDIVFQASGKPFANGVAASRNHGKSSSNAVASEIPQCLL